MLQCDGHPTALSEAIAMYGRIFKSLHILSCIDVEETYRRDIKGTDRQELAGPLLAGRPGTYTGATARPRA